MPSLVTFRVYIRDLDGLPGVWTDVSDDLNAASGMKCFRGIRGNSPLNVIADTGSFEFTLKNHAGNSRQLQGLYSPNNSNCRDGFGEGAWVRLTATFQAVEYYLWTGKIRTATPAPGRYESSCTTCLAQDAMADLAEADIVEIGQQINQTEDVLFGAVIDALETEAQPLATAIDAGLDTLPVAFDDLGSGAKGRNVLERVATSTQSKVFIAGDGTFTTQNRETIALKLLQHTFDDGDLTKIEVPSDLGNVFNRLRGTSHPRDFSDGPMVLAAHTGRLAIEPGAPATELFLTYQDPARPETQIGGTDFIDPIAVTDYVFNDAEDGSGTDVTADVTVIADFFPSAVKLTIQTAGLVTAYRQLLQARGTGIYNLTPVTRQSFTPMTYGNRPLSIDFPYADNDNIVQEFLDYLQASYRELKNQVNACVFYPQCSDTLMLQALTRELGDVVGSVETVTLPDGARAFINSIDLTITSTGWFTCRYGLSPRIAIDETPVEDLPLIDALLVQIAAPETRIDEAHIDFSEVA
jgi:hypothetical protein